MSRPGLACISMYLAGLLFATGLSQAQAPQTAAQVAATFDHLASQLGKDNIAPFVRALPASWRVRTADRDFVISSDALRRLLATDNTDGGSLRAVNDAEEWLRTRARYLAAYDSQPAADVSASLRQILARPEFAPPPPPSPWQVYRDRFDAWLLDLWRRMLKGSGRVISGNVVFWAALLGAIGLLIYWVVSSLRQRPDLLNLAVLSYSRGAAQTEEWLAAMRASAAEGDWRKAIQCAYWAGIARLLAAGALPSTSGRTPRESLRLLSAANAHSSAVPALRALTQALETFWYGCASATAADLAVCTGSLQDLGCKLD